MGIGMIRGGAEDGLREVKVGGGGKRKELSRKQGRGP